MTYLAFRNLWQQKFRLALSIGGVALAMMLIVFLNGFQSGIFRQVTAYLDHTPADVVVAQEDVTHMLGATSLLPASATDLARGAPGVKQVIPIVSRFIILDIHDKKVVAYLVGYEPKGVAGRGRSRPVAPHKMTARWSWTGSWPKRTCLAWETPLRFWTKISPLWG